jgi:uncharacterized protein (TIGR03067 family)
MRASVQVFLLFLLAGCGKEKPAPVPPPTGSAVVADDSIRIRGVWTASSLRREEGKPEEVPNGYSLNFENGNYSMEVADSNEAGRYTLISTTNPKQIDLVTNDGGLRRGLYSLDGDKLTICMPDEKDSPRPTEFKAAAEDNRITVITFSRNNSGR